MNIGDRRLTQLHLHDRIPWSIGKTGVSATTFMMTKRSRIFTRGHWVVEVDMGKSAMITNAFDAAKLIIVLTGFDYGLW